MKTVIVNNLLVVTESGIKGMITSREKINGKVVVEKYYSERNSSGHLESGFGKEKVLCDASKIKIVGYYLNGKEHKIEKGINIRF